MTKQIRTSVVIDEKLAVEYVHGGDKLWLGEATEDDASHLVELEKEGIDELIEELVNARVLLFGSLPAGFVATDEEMEEPEDVADLVGEKNESPANHKDTTVS